MNIAERCFIWLQYLLPQHALSWLVHQATRWTWRPWKNLLIRTVVARFGVDMSEARESDPTVYPSFNAFFTRELKAGARPIDAPDDAVVCPADGVISQLGHIAQGSILQAKGKSFALAKLLADDLEWSERFEYGAFLTVYLSPRDYHRVHMPISARLLKTCYVPGRLFSVDERSTRGIPEIFARNERLICYFSSDAGPMAVIMVGALMVSAIDTVWQAPVPPARQLRENTFDSSLAPNLTRGAEMGRFNMGSTVILLFGPSAVHWQPALAPQTPLRMGQWIASRG